MSKQNWVGKLFRILPMMVILSMLLAACGAEATPTTGTGAAQPTATTAAADQPTATTAAMEPATATTAAGAADATATTGGGAMTGGDIAYPEGAANITLWHGYTGAEADTLTKVVAQLQAENPDFKVELLAVPFDQLQNKFTTEVSTGGGSDLLIGPNDWVGSMAEADLIAELGGMDMTDDITGNLVPSAVDVNEYDGKLYAIPTSLKTVALYYNKDIVKEVPKDTDQMLEMAGSLVQGNVQYGLAMNTGFFHTAGYNYAFGGKLFTDADTVDLTTPGSIAWLNFLKKAKDSKGVFGSTSDADLNNLFKNGQAGMTINGPWALKDYQDALGADKVGVAVGPAATGAGKFAPFAQTENYYVNAASSDENKEVALKFINYIVSPGIAAMFVEAGQISTNTEVDLSGNPALETFVQQAGDGTPFPNVPAMGKVWDPAGNMISKVLDGQATAEDAAKEATDAINTAIGGQ